MHTAYKKLILYLKDKKNLSYVLIISAVLFLLLIIVLILKISKQPKTAEIFYTESCMTHPIPNPCSGATLCNISNCLDITINHSGWSSCSMYDFDGDCQIKINDLSACSSKCKTDGNYISCCNANLPCANGLKCGACDQSGTAGLCVRLPSPSPSLSPSPWIYPSPSAPAPSSPASFSPSPRISPSPSAPIPTFYPTTPCTGKYAGACCWDNYQSGICELDRKTGQLLCELCRTGTTCINGKCVK